MPNNRICSTEFRIDVRIAHRARTASTNCSSVNSPWTNFSKRYWLNGINRTLIGRHFRLAN
jgi:hypothetical protein